MTQNNNTFNDSQLDAMLAQWPAPSRSVGEWDAKVAQLMARLDTFGASGDSFSEGREAPTLYGTGLATGLEREREPSDEKILLAPALDGVITPPKSATARVSEGSYRASRETETESNESSLEDRMSGAERSRSLKDLAKMAQSSPPSSMSRAAGPASVREDSGMIDLAATFGQDSAANNTGYSDPAAPMHSMTVEKSQNAMSVPHIPAASTLPSFDLPPSSHAMVAAPPSSALAPNSYAPESASSVASVAAPVSAHPMHVAPVNPVVNTAPAFDASIYAVPPVVTQKSGSGKVIAIGLVGLFAVAAAAAGFMFVSKSKTTDTAPVAKVEAPASPVAVAPKAETQAPVAAVDPNAGVDLNNLPTQAQPGKPVAPAAKAAPGGPLAAAAPLAAAPPAAEKPEAKKPEAPKAPEGPAGSLNDAMKQAVGPVADNANQAKSEGPQFAAGTVPQKPSQGALTSALASVMGSAKACGADEEGVSRATVTFQSAGTVQSVNVSGAAAGKPAAECIKGALMKAKVAPFAEPTFTTSVTIRH